MQYKTIVLELLKSRTRLHEQLRRARLLMPAMETCASLLKASHEEWIASLTKSQPGSDPGQISSQALEFSLKELEDRLPDELPTPGDETLFLDEAMAFLRKATPKK